MDANYEARRTIVPAADICQEGDKVQLRLEMPGVSKDDIEIKIEDDNLSVSGRRPAEQSNGRYAVRERLVGDYYKRYTLDETIDRNRIDALMRGGVLTVTLHVKEAAKPRKIEIKTR